MNVNRRLIKDDRELEDILLEMLSQKPTSTEVLCYALDQPRQAIHRKLSRLERHGEIQRVTAVKVHVWRTTRRGKAHE